MWARSPWGKGQLHRQRLPSRRYPAEVTRVSFGSTKTDNVVTYITWLDVDNSDLSLRPGMTAAATITPPSATTCCWCPTPPCASPRPGGAPRRQASLPVPTEASSARSSCPARHATRQPQNGWGGRPGAGQTRQIWLLQDGCPQPVSVKVGISDGRMTEVSAEGPGARRAGDHRPAHGQGGTMTAPQAEPGRPAPRRPSSVARRDQGVWRRGAGLPGPQGVDLPLRKGDEVPSWAPAGRANPPR